MYLKRGDKCKLDKLQARLIKCILGINANHKTRPLLSALNVTCLSQRIVFRNIMLLRKILYNDSLARTFNLKMLKLNNNCEKILINRVRSVCSSNGTMLYDMLIKNECVSHLRKKLLKKTPPCQDGLIDTPECFLKTIMTLSLIFGRGLYWPRPSMIINHTGILFDIKISCLWIWPGLYTQKTVVNW